jgi:hypothetical protein
VPARGGAAIFVVLFFFIFSTASALSETVCLRMHARSCVAWCTVVFGSNVKFSSRPAPQAAALVAISSEQHGAEAASAAQAQSGAAQQQPATAIAAQNAQIAAVNPFSHAQLLLAATPLPPQLDVLW